MTHNVPFTITAQGLTMQLNGKLMTVANDHINYRTLVLKLTERSFKTVDELVELANVRKAVARWISKDARFELDGNNHVTLDGKPFAPAIADKVMNMIQNGHNPEPLYHFLRKTRDNPSATAQDELLLFCVANGFQIHEDGDILAYKAVRKDYLDIYSGKISNKVGAVVTMIRNKVDDDRETTCSYGLHFAAREYALNYGGETSRMMIMKINPRDVVSIPSDYHNQKGRCCRYEVYAEIDRDKELPKSEVHTDDAIAQITITISVKETTPAAMLDVVEITATKRKLDQIDADRRNLRTRIARHQENQTKYKDIIRSYSEAGMVAPTNIVTMIADLNRQITSLHGQYQNYNAEAKERAVHLRKLQNK
jgi:hypothetical protein